MYIYIYRDREAFGFEVGLLAVRGECGMGKENGDYHP